MHEKRVRMHAAFTSQETLPARRRAEVSYSDVSSV